jgi:hypothetical protein
VRQASLATLTDFMATYKAVGSPTTITFAQLGGRTSFSSGPTTFYSNGTTNTVCDNSGGRVTCYSGAQPLTGVLALVQPQAVAQAIRQAASTQATSVAYSAAKHDGLASSCVAYALQGQNVKYCLDGEGVVTFIRIVGTATFVLSSLTGSVPEAAVSVPPGAITSPSP